MILCSRPKTNDLFLHSDGMENLSIGLEAILPGDLGFGLDFLALVFVIFTAGVLISLFALYRSTKHPDDSKRNSWPKHERYYALIVLIVLLIFATSTLGLLPYPYAHTNISPTMIVNVEAYRFQFCIAQSPNWGTQCQADLAIPVGSVVLFNVTSLDTTHGFGIYSPGGQIIDQVQVMPGFYNSIIYQFNGTGTYYIRCLEFCGWGHFGMVSQLNVTQV